MDHREVCCIASSGIYPRRLGDVFAHHLSKKTESPSVRVEEVAVSNRSVTVVAIVLYLRYLLDSEYAVCRVSSDVGLGQ